MTFLTGSTFEEVRQDVYALMYLDPRIIYSLGAHLVTELASYLQTISVGSMDDVSKVVATSNSKIASILSYRRHVYSVIDSASTREYISNMYSDELTLHTNRLRTGTFVTAYRALPNVQSETVWGPFPRELFETSSYDGLYLHGLVFSSEDFIRASELVSLLGGSIDTQILHTLEDKPQAFTNIDTQSGSVTDSEGQVVILEYPFILATNTLRGKSELVVSNNIEQLSNSWLADDVTYEETDPELTLSMVFKRERVSSLSTDRLSGPLFLSTQTHRGIIEQGPVFKGDRIKDSEDNSATIQECRDWRVRLDRPLQVGEVTVLCAYHRAWVNLESSLKKFVVDLTTSFAQTTRSLDAQVQQNLRALQILMEANTQDGVLSTELVNIKKAHYNIGADLAYFLLDSSRILDYSETSVPSSGDALRIASDQVRKRGY